jgi:hypothetical protein
VNEKKPLVSCLTATAGRFSVLREAVACFLAQDYPEKELVILNNHPTPLVCDLPGVRVVNEPKYASLGDCRNRLLELAQGDLVRTWDDDDLYLPWAISQGVEHLGEAPAFKPKFSWAWNVQEDRWSLDNNVFEAAMTVRAAVARKYGYTPASGGDEHHPLSAGIEKEGGCKLVDMGWRASYVYRWGTALQRISGTLGDGKTIAERTQEWLSANQDTGDGKPLTPADLTPRWTELAKAAAAKFPKDEALIRVALKLPAAIPAAMRIPGMPAPVPIGKPGEAPAPAVVTPPPVGVVALQCACGKQPGVMVRAGKQWYLMRVESSKNQSTVYGEKIAFCRGCFRPLQQEEPSAVPYEFGHDSAFDKQVRLLK